MNVPPDPREHDALALRLFQLGGRLIDDPGPPGPPEYGPQRETAIDDPDWEDWEQPEYVLCSRPEDVPGLREVVVSVARVPDRWLNPLVLLCPASHVMGRVYRTPSGLVLVGCGPPRNMADETRADRRDPMASFVITLDAPGMGWRSICKVSLGCRCRRVDMAVTEVKGMLCSPGHPHRVRIEWNLPSRRWPPLFTPDPNPPGDPPE